MQIRKMGLLEGRMLWLSDRDEGILGGKIVSLQLDE
jgi:hypothetical protein